MLFMSIPLPPSPNDRRKIEKLYERYHRLIYFIAYHILHHHEDAEDAVIEAWEKIIRHLDKINEINCQETQGLLVIIVERTAIDYYRRNKKQRDFETLSDDFESSPYFTTKDKAFENAELYQVLRHIPKKYSEVLILYYVNGFTGKEIANLLNIKEDAVMTRLSRGRKLLKKELSDND